ncbi:hypothetical protein KEM48_003147 [Puccinia striiformis f. sp. tritici PST-130]|nr:hypothetical protein KEM48_003147 [Puccinia striiformis f. sp. tritici PST-130]
MPNTTNNSTQSMINSYLNLASHDPESINTAHSPKDKETLSDEDNSCSFQVHCWLFVELEDRKRGHKSTWEAAKSPAATKMYIDVNHNKQSFEEFKIAAADTNIQLEAAAAKSGSSHQAVNDDNSKEDYSDNEGSIIKDIDLYTDRDQILKRYGVGCRYNQIFPSFLHPTEITKYIPLSAEKIHIWANALLEKKSGVSIDSPPSEFHCKVRQKAGAAAELALPPPPNPETTAMNAALTVWNYSLGNGAWKGMSA